MLIPARKKALLRKYEGVIFHSDRSKAERAYSFYLLMRPILAWVKSLLVDCGLEPDEAESELYILSYDLFSEFDSSRSSIIPYLEKLLGFKVQRLLETIRCKYQPVEGLGVYEPYDTYTLDEEFYWRVPGILFEEKYVGKCFTRGEKYIIYKILVADDNELWTTRLATGCGMERGRMKTILSDMRDQLKESMYD